MPGRREENCEMMEVFVEDFAVERNLEDKVAFQVEACQKDEAEKRMGVVVAVVVEKERKVRYQSELAVEEDVGLLEPFVALSLAAAFDSEALVVRVRASASSLRELDREDSSSLVEAGERENGEASSVEGHLDR